MIIKYSINESTLIQVKFHLNECSKNFIPELSTYVDIDTYSTKLFQKSTRIEAFLESELIGLIAIYINEQKKDSFISNVSVLPKIEGNGVAKTLFAETLKLLKQLNINKISLEVDFMNIKAITFYEKFGFKTFNVLDKKIVMNLNL
jgi:ribosomal protein S18 acetylase RimI-like enzyme